MAHLLVTLLQIYSYIILARIIVSWIPNINPMNPFIQFLRQATEPVLEPIRRATPPLGSIDISPIIVFVLLRILQGFILRTAGDI